MSPERKYCVKDEEDPGCEITLEAKEKALKDLRTYLDNKFKAAVELREDYLMKYQHWKNIRQETIARLHSGAQKLMQYGLEIDYKQTACKMVSIAAKGLSLATPFVLPTSTPTRVVIFAVGGIVVAALGEGASGLLSEKKLMSLKQECDCVRRALENDGEETMYLLHLLRNFEKISAEIKKCVEVLHASVVNAFFRDFQDSENFAASAERANVAEAEGFMQFIHNFGEWTATRQDSAQSLTRYDPEIVKLIYAFPKDIVEFNTHSKVISELEEVASPEGRVNAFLKGFNAFSVVKDIYQGCISQENSNMKLANVLSETVIALRRERNKILTIVEKL